jgi:DNA-binding NtrC family response regulator
MEKKGKIFLLDDDELIITVLSRALKKDGYETYCETQPSDVISKIQSQAPDVVLLDITLPGRDGIDILKEIIEKKIDTQVVMLTADDTVDTAVKAMKLGAADYITKPFGTDKVKITIKNIIEKEDLKQEVSYLRKTYSESINRDFVGKSNSIKQLLEKVEKLAQAHVSAILITGESGTGKEVIARHIHDLMHGPEPTRHAPYISINCAAMPENLLESELFGYEKGSFTDAKSSRIGLFEQANGGTILLDEIGDMKIDLQTKLLRVLEERKIRPIGGDKEIPVDATIIATTNKNIAMEIESGKFRKDLFYRLSNFYLHIIPLRERKEDIPVLAKYFIKKFEKKYNKTKIEDFSPEARQLLMEHSWPGNVRELKNLMERFVVLENCEVILPEHIPQWITKRPPDMDQVSESRFVLPQSGISMEALEKDLILQALERAKNNYSLAAKLLDVTYDSFRYQLKKFGIK